MFRCISILLCLISPLRAAGEESASLLLERGVFHMDTLLEPSRAKALFIRAVQMQEVPARVAAEAYWLLAEACRKQGRDEVAILLLNTLVREFPAAQPFTPAAAALAVELARGNTTVLETPNGADLALYTELGHIAQAALVMGDRTASVEAFQDLDDVSSFMLFELSISSDGETPDHLKARMNVLTTYEKSARSVKTALAALKSGAEPSLVLDQQRETLKEIQEQELDPHDLSREFCAARDALSESLGKRDAAAVAAAVKRLRAAGQPLIGGPQDLALIQALRGEAAASIAVEQQAAAGHFSEALRTWRLSRRLYFMSGIAGAGLVIVDADDIPPPLRLGMLGAILFVEAALFDLLSGGESSAALEQTSEAIKRLTAMRDASRDAPCRKRLDRSIHNLKQAESALASGESTRAADLLRTEMYVTP